MRHQMHSLLENDPLTVVAQAVVVGVAKAQSINSDDCLSKSKTKSKSVRLVYITMSMTMSM